MALAKQGSEGRRGWVGSLEHAIDARAGRPVRDELRDALAGDAELIGHTVATWAASRLGRLSKNLPEELVIEIKRDLPSTPIELLRSAITTELFNTAPFKGVLTVLHADTRTLVKQHFAPLPAFEALGVNELPFAIAVAAQGLGDALSRIRRAISFGSWQRVNQDAVNAAIMAIITKKNQNAEPVTGGSPLGVKRYTSSRSCLFKEISNRWAYFNCFPAISAFVHP